MTMKIQIYVLSIVLMGLFILGCSDDSNPVNDDHNDEHFEAIGLFVINSGDTIAAYTGGEVSGQIEATVGEETPLLSVKFLTEDGHTGVPESDEFGLKLEIADTALAGIEQHDGEDYAFHVIGKREGQTSIEISILHHDHPDFVSKPIPVMVSKAQGMVENVISTGAGEQFHTGVVALRKRL